MPTELLLLPESHYAICSIVIFNASLLNFRQSMEQMFQEMLNEDSGEFQNFCRMSPNDFDFLLSKVEPLIKKQKTRLRIPIPAKVRLAITLRFLATGDSYRSLHYLFKVSSAAISIIVQDVCNAINTVLKDQIKVRN